MLHALLSVVEPAPVADSTIYRWAALLLGQLVIFSGLVFTYLVQRKTSTKVDVIDVKADSAASAASKAAAAVAPISNGFAAHTGESLDSIKTMIYELRIENTDNLNTLRVEASKNLDQLRGLLVNHIADHAASDLRKN